MSKKILIFEDETKTYGPYQFANELEFNGELELRFIAKSQSVHPRDYKEYDIIFIDIQLAKTSVKDGYAIIDEIRQQQPEILNRVVIVTGNSMVSDKLSQMGIETNVTYLIKPIGYVEIANIINDKLNKSK